MALSILDGNQSATTLSTILSSGQHITAHTVVSLGTQAITDIRGAVSGSVVSISNFPATQPVSIASVTVGNTVTIAGTVTANLDPNASVIASQVENGIAGYAADLANDPFPISGTVTIGNTVAIAGTVTANPTGTQTIAGTVTAMAGTNFANEIYNGIFNFSENAQMGVYVTDPLPTGSNNIGRVTVGAGTVTIGAGTAQIGSVTASISGTVPVSISSVTVGNSVTIASLPAISGTVTVGAVSTTVTIANHQGTSVTTSNFTSTTASTTLASANASREVLTIFNEGAGNLHICAGATCTTIAYQVRLSAGDYYEVPLNQTSLTHSAVFATAGTARVTEVS